MTSRSGGQPYSVQVIVPTRNGGGRWKQAATAIKRTCASSKHAVRVAVVDTASSDGTQDVAIEHGFEVAGIQPIDFDHGGTRNTAVDSKADVAVFLTQDAVPDSANTIDALVSAFDDPTVAVAYGRQLPHEDANPIARHARLFNYPPEGRVCTKEDAGRYGIKAVFSSNSFAAYRVSVFRELGGFPSKLILSEDMYVAAKAAMAGYRVAYVAEAAVRHSHNYSPIEEFRRYFDIGVFQAEQSWIAKEFGGAGGEGKRFLVSEFRYLLRHAPLWLPRAALHNVMKILGYRLGKAYRYLPRTVCQRLSMHPRYWR